MKYQENVVTNKTNLLHMLICALIAAVGVIVSTDMTQIFDPHTAGVLVTVLAVVKFALHVGVGLDLPTITVANVPAIKTDATKIKSHWAFGAIAIAGFVTILTLGGCNATTNGPASISLGVNTPYADGSVTYTGTAISGEVTVPLPGIGVSIGGKAGASTQ